MGDLDQTSGEESYRYWAFISYSSRDKQWARWLHRSIESYGIPAQFVAHPTPAGQPAPKRFHPLFRDRDELPASSDLGGHLKEALRASRYLIVICSPHAARSQWVNTEIVTFQNLGRHDRIFILLADGEPHAGDDRECFPDALRQVKPEPKAADARPQGDGKEKAKLALLAGMLGVNLDSLIQREKSRKLQRRISAVVAAMIFIGMILGVWHWQEQRRIKVAKHARIDQLTEQGRQELVAGSPLRALPFLSEAYLEGGTGAALRFLLAQAAAGLDSQVASVGGPTDPVSYATFSPDGTRFITANAVSRARVWDAATGALLFTLEDACDRTSKPSFSPDGSRIVTARGKRGKLWDATDGRQVGSLDGHKFDVKTVEFSPEGSRVITASVDDTAKVWNAADGRLVVSLTGHAATVSSAAFSPDGKRALTVSVDDTAKVWDTATGSVILTLPLKVDGLNPAALIHKSASFSHDGRRILTLTGSTLAQIWDAATGMLTVSFDARGGRMLAAKFGFQGTKALAFATSTEPNSVVVWDIEANKVLSTLEGHKGWINTVDCSPNGSRFITSSWDTTAMIWDAVNGRPLATLEGHKGFLVASATYSRDGTRVITVDGNGTAKVWDATGGKLRYAFQAHADPITSVVFSPNSTRLATAGADRSVKIWDAGSGKQLNTAS